MVESRSICKASKLQDEPRKLQEWSNRNDMKLNASKCSVMQISFCKQPVQQTALFIDDTQLCNVEFPKILGLIVQSDLKWNKHVTDLLKRSNKKLYILRRLKSFKLPIVDLITIFRGYIRPIVEYCAPVFNGALTKQHIYALESIQKKKKM